jgi:transcriptional regulator of acetoin/glycerol metabolism
MADGPELGMPDLPPYLYARLALPAPAPSPAASGTPGPAASALEVPREAWQRPAHPPREGASFTAPSVDLGDGFLTLADMEKQLIRATLERLKGNQSIAARKLGISRSTLWRKMKEYGLEA